MRRVRGVRGLVILIVLLKCVVKVLVCPGWVRLREEYQLLNCHLQVLTRALEIHSRKRRPGRTGTNPWDLFSSKLCGVALCHLPW